MNEKSLLPSSPYINTTLGLKYLNNNQQLYLKILNRFVERYKEFNVYNLKEEEFKSQMHALKGLSSTLGMEKLSELAQILEEKQSPETLKEFSSLLTSILMLLH